MGRPILAFLIVVSIGIATFADESPQSSATAAVNDRLFRDHEIAVEKAKQSYDQSLATADTQYIAELDTALNKAMTDHNIDLARALDDQKKLAVKTSEIHALEMARNRSTPIDFTWRRVDCPAPMMRPHMAAHGGKLYLLGGTLGPNTGCDEIWIYDLKSNEWKQSAVKMPCPVWSIEPPLLAAGQLIISPGFGPEHNNGFGIHNRLIEYDFDTGKAMESVDYPGQDAIWGVALASVKVDDDVRCYAFGGSAGSTGAGIRTICRYDPVTDKLTPIDTASLNTGRHVLATASDQYGRVALFGAGIFGGDNRAVQVFDARRETIESLGNILPDDIREDGCCFAWCDADGDYYLAHFNSQRSNVYRVNLDSRKIAPASFSLPPRRFNSEDCQCTYDATTHQFYFMESKLENGTVVSDLWIGTPAE